MNKYFYEIPEQIETDRLILRPYGKGDGPILHSASQRNKEHLSEFESVNFLMHIKNEQHAEVMARDLWVNWVSRKSFFWGIFEKDSQQWIGQVFAVPTDWALPEFMLGYVADVNFVGKGNITEAVQSILKVLFVDLKAYRVRSDCNENNERSWRLLERCNFVREGHLRNNRRGPNGKIHGTFLYAQLAEEYQQANSASQTK